MNLRKFTIIVLLTSIFLCNQSISFGKSQAELIDVLLNDPNTHIRRQAALVLQQIGDSAVDGDLIRIVKNDPSSEVRIICLRTLASNLDKSASDIYKKEPRSVTSDETVENLREAYRAEFRNMLGDSYKFNCKYPSDIKVAVLRFFTTSDKPSDLILLLKELQTLCAMPYSERKKLERNETYRGDYLLNSLIRTISARRSRFFKTEQDRHYSDNVEGKFIPVLENELKYAKDDYRLSLLVILGEISTHEKYDVERKNYFNFYTLDQSLLSEIEEKLIKTKSPYLKREALRVLNYYDHQLKSDETAQIKEEFAVRDNNLRVSEVTDDVSAQTTPEEIPRFSRPEERGEDMSVLETPNVVNRMFISQDKIELRKAAKVLGDRAIASRLNLSREENESVNKIVDNYLKQSKATTANKRVEARHQIERLWHVAVPELLKNMSNRNPTIAELSVKSLILMRNEDIIRQIIDIAKTTNDPHTKAVAIFTLKKMKEQRKSRIPGRKCLNEEESKVLYDRLVAPALVDLERNTNH
jgi:HEAT repeat protein